MLYDGHGSVRQKSYDNSGTANLRTYQHDWDGAGSGDPAITYNAHHYDAYGNSLVPQSDDGLGYAGEMWDADVDHSYNRARYYNPSNGRWNRVDPYAGNNADPQSLHKYLYAHDNPVNMIDPSGMEGIIIQLSKLGIKKILFRVTIGALIGIGLGGVIGGSVSAYLHILTHETFEGIGSAIWHGVKGGAIWGAIIGASTVNPQILAIVLTATLGWNTGKALLALSNKDLPTRTKVAIVALLLLQGVLFRASIQRGIVASKDPNYTANANARTQYIEERPAQRNLVRELERSDKNIDNVARAAFKYRNSMKVRARDLMNKSDRAKLEAEMISRFGNKLGRTYEQALEKYNTPEAVIEASMRFNPKIDASYGPQGIVVPFPALEDLDE